MVDEVMEKYAADRDVYFEDLKLMNELQVDYNVSYIQALKLGRGD
jgi:hypothetical protein